MSMTGSGPWRVNCQYLPSLEHLMMTHVGIIEVNGDENGDDLYMAKQLYNEFHDDEMFQLHEESLTIKTEEVEIDDVLDDCETCPVCLILLDREEFKSHLESCIDLNKPKIQCKEEQMDFKNNDLSIGENISSKLNNDQEVFCQDQVDARMFYPVKNKNDETNYFQFLDTKPFSDDVIKFIEIMEKSCCHFVIDATGNNVKEFFCPNCNRYFQSSENFASHLYAHTFMQKSALLEPVICSGCGLEFRNRENWQKHAENTTNYCPGQPKTIYGCQLCHKIFTQKHILRKHLKTHIKCNI